MSESIPKKGKMGKKGKKVVSSLNTVNRIQKTPIKPSPYNTSLRNLFSIKENPEVELLSPEDHSNGQYGNTNGNDAIY